MNIHDVATECLTYVERLSPEDHGNMLAVVAMERSQVERLLKQALQSGNAVNIQFMQVAWFLHVVNTALRKLESDR